MLTPSKTRAGLSSTGGVQAPAGPVQPRRNTRAAWGSRDMAASLKPVETVDNARRVEPRRAESARGLRLPPRARENAQPSRHNKKSWKFSFFRCRERGGRIGEG